MRRGGATIREVLAAQFRVLSFRFGRGVLEDFAWPHLAFGLFVTWLVGIGRYWDHPDPYLTQRLGIGSVLIVAAVSVVLYVIVLPLRPDRWDLRHLTTFVSLAALPALFYAIPVERFLSPPSARTANVAMLALVATWRVGLLGVYLRRHAGFSVWLSTVALLLPVAFIITALTMLNLERAVFDLMSGLRGNRTPADAVYLYLNLLSVLSVLASPALGAVYVGAIWLRSRRRSIGT